MNIIEQSLITSINQSIHSLYQIDAGSMVMIEIPKDNNNGDFATNIAMRLAKQLKKAPVLIAEELKKELIQNNDLIETVEVAGPGFINFRLKKEALGSIITQILKLGSDYGRNKSGQNQKILVEYVSANPTGNLHAGHARGAVWGDCITRLLNFSGYDCLREYYLNDAGVQMKNLGLSTYARYAAVFGEEVEIPEDGYMGEDVKIIGETLAQKLGDVWLNKEEGRQEFFTQQAYILELEKIKEDLKEFRIEFDSWISEQSLYDSGKVEACIREMKEKGLCYESEGALWFKSTQWGDDKDRVLIKADKTYTYLTPDIANHLYKFERGYNKCVNLWGADHHGYIPRMKAAMMAFGYSKDDLEVDIIQMVRLIDNGVEVKMSKRTGNAITIRELIEDIGVDATRYFFVSRAVDTHFDFDLSLARKQTNENPVYYIQYAHARICTILNNYNGKIETNEFKHLVSEKETDLLKYLNEFENIVIDAALSRSPNKICNYVYKLAGYFHSFYGAHKIIDKENPVLTSERIGLLKATKTVLVNALDLLGINSPESM